MKLLPTTHRFIHNLRHFITRTPAFFYPNILLTYRCTQRCLQCSVPDKKTDPPFMPVDDFKLIVDRLERYGTQGCNLSGGEPLLHPAFPELAAYAAGKGFVYLNLLTNLYGTEQQTGQAIDTVLEHGIGVTCSFDGLGVEADRLRGVPDAAATVMRNMERLTKANRLRKKRIVTRANVVVSRLNLDRIPEMLDYLENLGWMISVDLYRWGHDNFHEREELKIDDYDRLEKVFALAKRSRAVFTPDWFLDGYLTLLRGGKHRKYCPYLSSPALHSKFFIQPDGNVVTCHGGPVGNLREQEPAWILASAAWKRQQAVFRACQGCWNPCYTLTWLRPADMLRTGIRLFRSA